MTNTKPLSRSIYTIDLCNQYFFHQTYWLHRFVLPKALTTLIPVRFSCRTVDNLSSASSASLEGLLYFTEENKGEKEDNRYHSYGYKGHLYAKDTIKCKEVANGNYGSFPFLPVA